MGLDISVELRGGDRVAGPGAGDRQPPGHVVKRGDRRDQQIVTFDRQHRTDR